MPALILYLLKVNVALVLFYLAYHFVLRRLTFYALNRYFLLFSIVFSTAYPFLDVSGLMSQHQDLASAYISTVPAWVTTPAIPEQAPAFDYWQIPVFLFWLGTGAMAIRLLLQFISLYKIHAASEPTTYMGIGFRQVNHITQAFSFWKAIYLNPTQHKATELESILQHELVHVQGWHTLDVLLAELNTVFYWFNPGAWLLKKAIKENLEFIADRKVIWAGADRKAYQYLLLKVVGAPEPQLANQFNFPSLKRRIAMMNKKKSSLLHVARYAVLVPLIVAPILFIACSDETIFPYGAEQTSKDVAMQYPIVIVTDEKIDTTKEYRKVAPHVLIKNNLDLDYVSWKRPNTLVVKPINEKAETFQLDDEQDLAEANRKYGVRLTAQLPEGVTSQNPAQDAADLPDDYRAFLKRNPTVRHINWQFNDQQDAIKSVVIHLKSGGSEVYDFNDKQSMATANRKYGELPALPPPPPPYKSYIPVYIPDNVHEDYEAFLKRNPEVKQLAWMIGDSFGRKARMLVVYLKSGKTETYDLDHGYSVDMAENKYGKLPTLPPPPPPVITEEEEVIPDIKVYTHVASTAPEDYKAFLKRNPEVRQISWESYEQQDAIKSVVIRLKSGGSEVYDFNDKQSMAAVERKYGKMPPPPPPVRSDGD